MSCHADPTQIASSWILLQSMNPLYAKPRCVLAPANQDAHPTSGLAGPPEGLHQRATHLLNRIDQSPDLTAGPCSAIFPDSLLCLESIDMPRVCKFSGARTTTGRKIHYRGRPKSQGGIGLKPSGISKRKIKPNIQSVRAIIDGRAVRIKATARSIRNGLVIKPLRRKYGWTRKMKQAAARA